MSKLSSERLKQGGVAFDSLRKRVGKLLKSKGITPEQQKEILEYSMDMPDWQKGAATKLFGAQKKLSLAKKDMDDYVKAFKPEPGAKEVSPYMTKEFKRKNKTIKQLSDEVSNWKGTGKKGYEPFEALDDETLEKFVTQLGKEKFYANPPGTGAFGNAGKVLGMGLQPIVNVARRYGGNSGVRLADALEDLGRTSTMRTGAVYRDLAAVFKDAGLTSGLGERVGGKLARSTAMAEKQGVREASTLLTEAGIFDKVPAGITAEYLKKASSGLSTAMEAASKAKSTKSADEIMQRFWKDLGPRAETPEVRKLIGVIQNHGEVSDFALRGINHERAPEMARWIRDYYRNNGLRFSNFTDARGRKFMIQSQKGKPAIPFREGTLGPTYVSHFWDQKKAAKGTAAYDNLMNKMAKEQNISVEQAKMLFDEQLYSIPKKAANVEVARDFNAGGYMLDPLEVIPRYAHSTEYRIAFAERFGIKGDSLQRLVDDVIQEGKYMHNIREMAFGRNKNDYGISDIINKVTGWQVLTKMGIGSTIANASQPINGGVMYGMGNMIRSIPKTFSKEGQKLAAGAYSKEVHNLLKAQAGVPANSAASKYLEVVGFGPVERWNGFWSAVMGDTAAKNLVAKLPMADKKQATAILNKLKAWGADPKELDVIAATGVLTPRSQQLIASKAVEMTQHAVRWEQMPMVWQNDWARIMLQYKNFAYNQTRFILGQVMQPAFEFAGSLGRRGDIKPFLRMVPLFVGAGEAVTHLKDLVRAAPRGVLTGDYEKQREYFWNSDDWMLSMMRDTLMVGSAGMMGDLWESAERGKLPEWIMGPTISDVAEIGTKAARAGRKAYGGQDLTEDFWNFSNWASRRALPGLGPTVPSGVELEKVLGLRR
jgi:hypothetical protein